VRTDRDRPALRPVFAQLQYPGQLLSPEICHYRVKVRVEGLGTDALPRILSSLCAREKAEGDAVIPGWEDDQVSQERKAGGISREILKYRHRTTPRVQPGFSHQVL
jgi:hypothetical protein